jgi:hypothetical protein
MKTGPDQGAATAAGKIRTGAIAVCFAAMALWTWGTWPDCVIDSGQQLYLPWRITEGEVLYRDLAFFNGPLSVYWNALWFAVFGTGMTTLWLVNLLLAALLVLVIYRVLAHTAGPLSATTGALCFIALFGFGQIVGIGNYNYVAPYSHEKRTACCSDSRRCGRCSVRSRRVCVPCRGSRRRACARGCVS